MSSGELIAAQRPPLADIEAALTASFSVRAGAPVAAEQTYYDTFDGLLNEDGLRLRHRAGRLELLTPEDRIVAYADVAQPAGPIGGEQLPAGGLRDAVLGVIDVRALLPLARLKVTTQTLALLDDLDKTVTRVTLISPVLLSGNRPVELRTRISVTGVRGYDDELQAASELTRKAVILTEAGEPLLDEAVRAAGGTPGGISSKVEVPMAPDERADVVVARVLRRLLEVIDANLPGVIADIDTEFLHDYRVSVRRTRAVQRELKSVFPPAELAHMREEFKWLQQVTGDSRDLDVYVLGFDSMRALVPEEMRPELEPLLLVLRRRRLLAHGVMNRDLRSDRARRLRERWGLLLDGLENLPGGDRPDAVRPIAKPASERIRKVYVQMLRMGEAIVAGGLQSPAEDYHELRKKGKELRYLLELFGQPLHDRDVVKPMVKTLKRLQDVLGHHQDREVQIVMLRGLRDEVIGLPGGAGALMAMGVLIERLEEDAAESRAGFAEVFSEFAGKSQRRLVKDTFS